MLTTWDPRILTLTSSTTSRFSLSTTFKSTTTDVVFTITNVYAPSHHSLTNDFFE
jgi:hypothetical protein